MNKTSMVAALADQTGQTKVMASQMLDAVLDIIMKTLKKGDQVTLTGFGTFIVRKTNARNGRNPKTGETLKIPAGKRPAFKSGKAFKAYIK